MMNEVLHWMFKSNVSVGHFVPSQHTTCSSSSAALASQKEEEQISSFATITISSRYPIKIPFQDSIVTLFLYVV